MAIGAQDLYDYLITQQIQRKAAGGPGLGLQETYGVVAGVQAAKEQSALRSRELNLMERKTEADIEGAEAAREGSAITGTAQMALQAPITYLAGKKMLAELGVLGTKAGTKVGTTGTGSALQTASTTSGGGLLKSAGISSPFTTTGGPATIGEVGWGVYGGAAGAGALAGAYGPYRQEAGKLALFGKGGEREQETAGGAIAGAGAGALAGAAMTSWSGPGAIVGTVVGAIAGGLSAWLKSGKKKGTVICSELRKQGKVSQELLDAEAIYKPNFSWNTYWGYRFWADGIVERMQKSPSFSIFMSYLAIPFLKELAHRVDPKKPKNCFGSLILKIGTPLCKLNYKRVMRKQTLLLLDKYVKAGN